MCGVSKQHPTAANPTRSTSGACKGETMSEPIENAVVDGTFDYGKGRLEPSSAFPEGRAIHRPMLPVTLRTIYDGWLSCYAVVDSGADYCAFPQSSRYRLPTRGAPRIIKGQRPSEFHIQDGLPSRLFARSTVDVCLHSHLPRLFDGLLYVRPMARVCTLPRVKSSTGNSGFSMGENHVATKVNCDTCENSLGAPVIGSTSVFR